MKALYSILSIPFQISSFIIDFFYKKGIKKSWRINIPVLSIGNISFGGEGKTPIVISLAKFFMKKGIKPAVLLRGYKGRKESEGAIVSNGIAVNKDWEEIGDEALLIAENLPSVPVIIGKRREDSGLKAIEMGVELIILDDGFQYRNLFRDMDIVIVSSQPSLKREFLSSISRANAILINEDFAKEEFVKKVEKSSKNLPIFKFRTINCGIFDKKGSMIDLKGEKVIAFCGIANPHRFLKALKSIPINPEKTIFFPDHHRFTLKDLEKIKKLAEKRGVKIAVTTEKDFIRLSKLPFSLQIVYSKIEVELEDEFYRFLLERLKI